MIAVTPEKTTMIKVDPLHPVELELMKGAELIKRGQVVAFPTETVYGLGADATQEDAVDKIYRIKERPSDNPLIVHFANVEDIYPYVKEFTDLAKKLAEVFWPGPLTMVLHRTDKIASNVTQGLNTVAVRIPAHPVARSLIQLSGVPLAAPSANLSGRPSPTTADHVLQDLDGRLPMIIDGGSTSIGVESTVINVTTDPPILLRPGGVTVEELRQFLPDLEVPETVLVKDDEQPISPGMKYTHYSPHANVILVEQGRDIEPEQLDQFATSQNNKTIILCTNTKHHHNTDAQLVGEDMKEIQTNLFASLRLLDDQGFDTGIFEGIDREKEGFAIMNRIQKAAQQTVKLD